MAELNITFAGTCVNLFDIVPGVPMRTVLPNAMDIRFGAVKIPSDPGLRDAAYYMMPHIPIARDRVVGGNHRILTGSYLRILNAKNQKLCRTPGGFSLSQYVKDFALNPLVVYEGYAAAYFDIFGGRVWTEGREGGAKTTRVSIKTEGTPVISVCPLPGTILPLELEGPIETHELHITNLDLEAATEDTHFDFLLNYLVAKGGIPRVLERRTPGMPSEPKELTMLHLGQRLKALGTLIETDGTVAGWHQAVKRGDEPGAPRRIISPPPHGAITDFIARHAIDPVPFNESCSPANLP